MTADQSLIFDESIELIDHEGIVSEGPFWFSVLAEGTTWGELLPIEVALNSLLADGGLVQTTGDGLREVFVRVEVQSTDPIGLGEGIALLHRATHKRTTLSWLPPGMDVRTVFEVETSNLLNPDGFDDLGFLKHKQVYRLRLVCQPYTRSENLTTEVAEGIPSLGTVVNKCESVAGWSTPTSSLSPAPTMLAIDSSDFVEGAGSLLVGPYGGSPLGGGNSSYAHRADLAVPLSLANGAYLSFAIKFETSFDSGYSEVTGPAINRSHIESFTINTTDGPETWNFTPAGAPYPERPVLVEALANGWRRYTIRLSRAMSATSLTWEAQQLRPAPLSAPHPRMKLDQIAVAETAVLGEQVLKVLDIGGSARTTGSIHVAAPADNLALEQVLAYTVPARLTALGFKPDLAQWINPGTPTTAVDGRTGYDVSIGYETSPVLEMPAAVFYSGAYNIVGDLRQIAGPTTFYVESTLLIGGQVAAVSEYPLSYNVPAAFANKWRMHSIGTIYLPPTRIPQASEKAKIRLRFKNGAGGIIMADIYAFPAEGDLTIIDCGTGTVGAAASSHLWIDAPAPENDGLGAYYRGATPTRQDSISAHTVRDLIVRGQHTLSPEPMLAFVRAGVQGPTVSAEYYKRWGGHAPE